MDQSLFSANHRLSQSITSFIASYCQGIHQTPFSRLIRSRKSKTLAKARLCATCVAIRIGSHTFSRPSHWFVTRDMLVQSCDHTGLVYLTWTTLSFQRGIHRTAEEKAATRCLPSCEGTTLRSSPHSARSTVSY